VALSLPVPAGFAVYLAEGDGNANGRPMGLVILRATRQHAVFAATFSPPSLLPSASRPSPVTGSG
jgi:hypothetical protein